MTRATNARVAGAAFLVYIAAGVGGMLVARVGGPASTIAAKAAAIAQHPTATGLRILLPFVEALCALALAVTLYALTRDEDREIALFGFACRVGEGLLGTLPFTTLGLRWLATASGDGAPDPATANAIGGLILQLASWKYSAGSTLFALGSTAFCWLFLRARSIPIALAWLGVLASALLLVCLPLQLARFIGGPITSWMWGPMAIFELSLALWFLITGGAGRKEGRGAE